MHMRGPSYYQWADSRLPNVFHMEEYRYGTKIDVAVRCSPSGCTQLFYGLYERDGTRLYEEYIEKFPSNTTEDAMKWGIGRARALVDSNFYSPARTT